MEFPELANACAQRGCSEKNDFLPFTCVAAGTTRGTRRAPPHARASPAGPAIAVARADGALTRDALPQVRRVREKVLP
jgi:hypothetical protein